MKHKQRYKNQIYSGAILLEALLMVAILMLATPTLIRQVQRRNDKMENLLVANEMKALHNSASSLLIFDKDVLLASMVDTIIILNGETMQTRLEEFGLPESFSLNNSLNLEHGILLHRIGPAESKMLTGYVISRFKNLDYDPNDPNSRELDPIKRNDILNALGFNSAYIDKDGEVVSSTPNYRIHPEVIERVGRDIFLMALEQKQNFGDFMAKQKAEDNPIYNTMFTILNMSGHDIKDVGNFTGSSLTVDDIKLKELTTVKMELNQLDAKEFNAYEMQEITNPAIITVSDFIVKNLECSSITLKELYASGNLSFGEIDTKELVIKNVGRIDKLGFVKSIETEVLRMQDFNKPLYGNDFLVKNAIVIVENVKKEATSDFSDSTSGWQNQKARISPNDSSTIVDDIIIDCPDESISDMGNGKCSLADEIIKATQDAKDIFNAALTNWPTWW